MIGVNGGGQLNVLVFEVGLIITNPESGEEEVITVAVHPLHVAPSSIQYSDRSRSANVKTTKTSVLTNAGRDHYHVSITGEFGVQSRGVGPLVGSGDTRFQRFRKEIVRLGDALYRKDVESALQSVAGSPLALQALRRFDSRYARPFLNFYDFWHDIEFSCQVEKFDFTKKAGAGAASGNTRYQMTVKEVGHVIGTGLSDKVIAPLFEAFTVWDSINNVFESYTPDALIEGALAVPGLAVTQLADSLEAVRSGVGGAMRLMGSAAAITQVPAVAAFIAQSNRLRDAASGSSEQLDVSGSDAVEVRGGALEFASTAPTSLDRYDERAALEDIEDAARWQAAAGVLFGMSREQYEQYLRSGGNGVVASTNIAGSTPHTVSVLDNEQSIVAEYGVAWADVLAANRLLPDEALEPGRVLLIPTITTLGPQPIAGLPVFGSHIGQAAWGVDITPDLEVVAGAPRLISGADVLLQGGEVLVAEFASALTDDAAAIVPAAYDRYLQSRVRSMFETDARIDAVTRVQIRDTGNGSDIQVEMVAINGERVAGGAG